MGIKLSGPLKAPAETSSRDRVDDEDAILGWKQGFRDVGLKVEGRGGSTSVVANLLDDYCCTRCCARVGIYAWKDGRELKVAEAVAGGLDCLFENKWNVNTEKGK